MANRGKYCRVTNSQLSHMVDFLEAHQHKLFGKSNTTKNQKKEIWDNLAAELNAFGLGTQKSVDKWQKTWRDQKSGVRTKAARIKVAQRKTGNEAIVEELSPLEERILKIIGSETAVGDENIEEGGFEVISIAEDNNNKSNGILVESSAINSEVPSTSFTTTNIHTPTLRQQPFIKPLTSTPCNKDAEPVPKRRKLQDELSSGQKASSVQNEVLEQITQQTQALKQFEESFCNKMDQLIEIGKTIAACLMSNNNV